MKKSPNTDADTPLMRQYKSIKAKHPDAVLLFRVGDFYETFGEDAVKASKILGIVLARRNNGLDSSMELAGFPFHALDTYLPKLVRAGQRVAICEQLEDPKLAKTLVKRGITEMVTPGVTVSDKILDHKTNNFLAAVHYDPKVTGIAFADISTGEFYAAEGSTEYIDKLLQNFRPNEVLVQKNKLKDFTRNHGDKFYTFSLDEWILKEDYARETLLRQFETVSLKGFGIEDIRAGTIAAGAVLHYLNETRHDKLKHILSVSRIEEDRYMWLDKFTIRNLELVFSPNEKGATLADVLDHTVTPMGGRLLKRWLMLPLKETAPIEERLKTVGYFVHHEDLKEKISLQMKLIGDLERMTSKIALARILPREVLHLKRALDAAEQVKILFEHSGDAHLKVLADQLNPCMLIREKIGKEIMPDPPVQLNKGGVIAEGVSSQLDDLRKVAYSGKDYLARLQQKEIEQTKIPSLKVGFNNVFGYYIEVTHAHKDKVPPEWIRKQTLTNAERYITAELKEYEEKILGAEEKILSLETRLFGELVSALAEYIQPIQVNASVIGKTDCLLSFATASIANGYVRPRLNDSRIIEIKNGRHPVIEKFLPPGEQYVANDIYLDNETQQILMITGPNMSGKSALLRQTALIVLMAQAGCFVPASSANIGLTDKIFTRVGASDNISSGESTFMVEMNETASILNNISDRSLLLLDEIGRGTSTYDGISIAWAIAEYLHSHPSAKPKTLFATHYHELNEMAGTMPRIRNYHVSVKETDNRVLFLRKLLPGGSEHSFGIHVARMAGMPQKLVRRAEEILKHLEKSHSGSALSDRKTNAATEESLQLSFFQLDDPVLQQIREDILSTDINSLTPVEALMKLNEIKKLLGKK